MINKLILLVIISSFSSNLFSQIDVTISGMVKVMESQMVIPYANVILKSASTDEFIMGTATNEEGRFTIENVASGNYILEVSVMGFNTEKQSLFVGELSKFLDVKTILLSENITSLNEVLVTAEQQEVSAKMDKKTYSLKDNISQSGGSILQAMQNLPSVTIQDGKVQLRGNDKVTVLIDGKQTALTGYGNQNGLDNIPASAIEKIEIINNPSSKYDANGNAGIINIIYKKTRHRASMVKQVLLPAMGLCGSVKLIYLIYGHNTASHRK